MLCEEFNILKMPPKNLTFYFSCIFDAFYDFPNKSVCYGLLKNLRENVRLVGQRSMISLSLASKMNCLGREPWFSGYGSRLVFQRLWVWIPAPYTGWKFFTFICVKTVMFVWKCKNKLKKRPGLAHILKLIASTVKTFSARCEK